MRYFRVVFGAGFLAVALVGVAGCGSGNLATASVTGKITYKGKPVPNGSILFVPTGANPGPTAKGSIAADGTYKLSTYGTDDGAIVGSHAVMIVALQDMSGRLPEDKNPLPPPIVPDRYMSTSTSGLTAEVKNEPNTIDFELKDGK